MKIVTVVGARPQFVKAAAVSRAIAAHNAQAPAQRALEEVIVHTGQHFDQNMSGIFFEEMHIPRPDYFLDINSMSHGAMTGRMLEKIEEVLLKEQPDYVLVYGDTNSTLAGALAAKKLHIRVVHVEAGLRSFNMRMPEEVNRILTDRISDILCCPTTTALANLKNEGFPGEGTSAEAAGGSRQPAVVNTGDVMLDAALYYSTFSARMSAIVGELGLQGEEFALCTIHRAENTDLPERLSGIFSALRQIGRQMKVVLPLHPRTQKIAFDMGLLPRLEESGPVSEGGLLVLPPVGYYSMIELLKHAKMVLTDSGGLQKEAFFFRKPCLTLRDETEWVELVEQRANVLVGADAAKIVAAVRDREALFADAYSLELYGKGQASNRIIGAILGYDEKTPR